MQKITDQKHNKETFLYATSRIFERAAYYGLRAILVIYLLGDTIQMESSSALQTYTLFTSIVVFAGIGGGILGDLLIGTKKAIIFGAIIQSIGAFILCHPSMNGVYLGIGLVAIGGALYSPNLIASYGRLYSDKTKLLDSGFTILYLAVNIGSFLGIFFLGLLGEHYGWKYGFIAAGILMLLSLVPLLFTNMLLDSKSIGSTEPAPSNVKSNLLGDPLDQINPIFNNIDGERLNYQKTSTVIKQVGIPSAPVALSKRIIQIAIISVLGGLFWMIFELVNSSSYLIGTKLSEIESIGITSSMWSYYSSILLLPIASVAIFLWTYFYTSHYFKLLVGFISAAVSVATLSSISESPDTSHVVIYFISLVFMGISEILIGPLLYSALTKYGNPKYLATLMSLAFIPSRLLTFLTGLFYSGLYEVPSNDLWLALLIAIRLSVVLLIYHLYDRFNRAGGDNLRS